MDWDLNWVCRFFVSLLETLNIANDCVSSKHFYFIRESAIRSVDAVFVFFVRFRCLIYVDILFGETSFVFGFY